MSREQGESQRLDSAREPSDIYEIEHVELLLSRFEKYAENLAERGEYQQPVFSGYTEGGLFVEVKSRGGLANLADRQSDFQIVFGDVMTGDIMHGTPAAVKFQPRYSGGEQGYVTGADMALELPVDEEGNMCRIDLAHTSCLVTRLGIDEDPQHLLPLQAFAADNRRAYLERTKVFRGRFAAMAAQRKDRELEERHRQWAQQQAQEKSFRLNQALAMKVARVATEQPELEVPERATRVDEVVYALAAKVVRTTVRKAELETFDNLTYLDDVAYHEAVDRDLEFVA